MAGSTSTGGSGPSNPPKILLAKPGLVTGAPVAGKFGRAGTGDEYTTSLRSRLPSSIGSLNLLSDSWDFHIDRFLPVTMKPISHSHKKVDSLFIIYYWYLWIYSELWLKLQFLTENTEFTVVGVIGPPGVGKSTIMNELYGFDATSPGHSWLSFYFLMSLLLVLCFVYVFLFLWNCILILIKEIELQECYPHLL